MKYEYNLILRILTAIVLLLISINIFYFLMLKPTLFLSYITLLTFSPVLGKNYLIINNQRLNFTSACIATSAYYLLAILILLTKDIKLKKGIYVFVTGIILILIANILRIDILILIFINYGKNLFDALHILFWKFLSIIYVFLVWIFLTWKFKIKTFPVISDIKKLYSEIKK